LLVISSERDLYVAERESQPLVVRVASTGTAQVQSMHYLSVRPELCPRVL